MKNINNNNNYENEYHLQEKNQTLEKIMDPYIKYMTIPFESKKVVDNITDKIRNHVTYK